ncbi:MAG TPA: DNA-formamidopyrimidine glycosylase family protein [Candidatus Eremiobacteraceae bacterium]|nr:DNA-formamidopyrimidine glycosylase family protein [Candidatus Eremiobacteraceae bacterium]
MPELPELELLRVKLTEYVTGRSIIAVIVDPKRQVVLRYPPADFARDLTGREFASVTRRGKFLEFAFKDENARLIVNPMLGGRFAFCTRAAPELQSTCFTLQLTGAMDLRFLDAVQMARVYLTDDPAQDVPSYADTGPDALDPSLTFEEFERRLKRHRGEIKNALRNQAFVAGIGNAYSDEILFAAHIRPLRRASTLKPEERRALYDAMRSTLQQSVETVRAQYDAGKHPLHKQDRSFMRIHGKKKTVCPRCGHRISSIHSGGETTYFCRGCQL